MFTDPERVATAFSEHFCATADTQQSPSHLRDMPRCSHSFYLHPTSADEVFQVMMSLKTTGAGLDHIDPFKAKLVSSIISPPLAVIINKLFSAGVFPSCLKAGKIAPFSKRAIRLLYIITGQSVFYLSLVRLSKSYVTLD